MPFSIDSKTENYTIQKITSFSGVTIKNNKCFCYPYNYLLISNNIGNYNIYKYENFSNSTHATFTSNMSVSIGCSGKIYPTNYKGIESNDEESIPMAKYPTCEWSADAYTNWLVQNSVNIWTSIMQKGIEMRPRRRTENFIKWNIKFHWYGIYRKINS